MTATLIIPISPPAGGKSTLAHWLRDSGFDPDGIVCPDDYRRIMTGSHADQTPNPAVFDVVDLLVLQRLRHGLNVYLDATNLIVSRRDELFNMAHGTDANIVIVLFDTTPEECARRNRHRPQPVPDDAMDRMFARYSKVTKFTLRREAESDAQVYTPEQFMSYSWGFLNA